MNTVSPYDEKSYKRAVEGLPTPPVVPSSVTDPDPKKKGRGRPKGSKNTKKVCPKCGTVIE